MAESDCQMQLDRDCQSRSVFLGYSWSPNMDWGIRSCRPHRSNTVRLIKSAEYTCAGKGVRSESYTGVQYERW